MHKSLFTENLELSIGQADNNFLTNNEKPIFYDRCKTTTKQKNYVFKSRYLIFFNTLTQKEN